jgi:hypothetical protein
LLLGYKQQGPGDIIVGVSDFELVNFRDLFQTFQRFPIQTQTVLLVSILHLAGCLAS